MDLNTTNKNIHWIEVMVATFFVGIVLVFMGSSVRSALMRERDALREATIAETRTTLEQDAAQSGQYPSQLPEASDRGFSLQYAVSVDGHAYALQSALDATPGVVICATPLGVTRKTTCTPVARQTIFQQGS